METYVDLIFETQYDGKFTIRVRDFNEELTKEDIFTAMDKIIQSNVIYSKDGELTKVVGANVVKVNKVSYVKEA